MRIKFGAEIRIDMTEVTGTFEMVYVEGSGEIRILGSNMLDVTNVKLDAKFAEYQERLERIIQIWLDQPHVKIKFPKTKKVTDLMLIKRIQRELLNTEISKLAGMYDRGIETI